MSEVNLGAESVLNHLPRKRAEEILSDSAAIVRRTPGTRLARLRGERGASFAGEGFLSHLPRSVAESILAEAVQKVPVKKGREARKRGIIS